MLKNLLFIFLSTFLGLAQKQVPENYFKHPLDIPLALTGTFGELRSNHFHAGIDIKTNEIEGLNVYASAAGRITRIKVSHGGYGKALYVSHPNGYTTVYGHLQKFSKEIQKYVKEQQYKKQSYEIQLYPAAGSFNVSQGDILGYGGNTGGSSGPHLHFEIRDKNSRPLNPLSYGMNVKDTQAPTITSLWGYSFDENSVINGTQNPIKIRLIKQDNGEYKTESISALGTIGFGVATYDKLDLAPNKNGVYKITTSLNGRENLKYEVKRISFSETRYANRVIDYPYYIENKDRITKLYIDKNNPVSIYQNQSNNGLLDIKDGLSYTYKVEITDHKKNKTVINITIDGEKADELIKKTKFTTPNFAKSTENFTYANDNINLLIPKGALYEDTYLSLSKEGDVANIHNKKTPLHKNMTLSFSIANYKEADIKKMYIGQVSNNLKPPYYSKTYRNKNRLYTKTRTFGSYSLFFDHEKPTILPINFSDGKDISNESFLKIKIDDTKTGIKSYKATINGKFILLEYDYKTGMLFYNFDDKIITSEENNLKLIVLDKVNNKAVLETKFYKKL